MIRSRRRKKCRLCGEWFDQWSSLQKCVKISCALEYARIDREKKERRERKQKLEALKTLRDHLKEAQVDFNTYIRFRDRKEPCISCGNEKAVQYHAGHYRTVKAAPQLRFNEDNCHKQCSQCNDYDSGNATEYRINLVKKIGVDRVEALENNNAPALFTIERVLEIKREYKEKLKREKSLAIDT